MALADIGKYIAVCRLWARVPAQTEKEVVLHALGTQIRRDQTAKARKIGAFP
jgi:hypothetical protein